MELTRTYRLPSEAHARLSGLVTAIEANPGRMIRPGEFDELQAGLDRRSLVDQLPDCLSEEDLVGILKLALLTECATDSYAAVLAGGGDRYGAPWLARFVRRVWTPDELTHAAPYKRMLLRMGFAEAELEREMREARERDYAHGSGDTPIHLTSFAMVQEYLTDNWHGLIARLLRRSAPEAARMASRIKQRETMHTMWYRDMTALQLEADSRMTAQVGEALLAFQMPGNVLVPELQGAANRWLGLMGGDVTRIQRDLVRLVHEAAGDVRRTGAILVQVAAERGEALGPFRPRQVKAAFDWLGGAGYGLVGEALLERAGLSYLFRTPGRTGTVARLRGLLRSWLARQIELDVSVPTAKVVTARAPL